VCSVSTLQKLTLLALPNSQTPFLRMQWQAFSTSSSALSPRGWCQSQDAGLPNVKDAVITSERGHGCGQAGCRIASEGSAFRPVLTKLLRISTCKESLRNWREINTCETKEFKLPEMSTYRKDGWGRQLSPLAVEEIQPRSLATRPTQSLARVEPLTE
jgi:hypothetical protein